MNKKCVFLDRDGVLNVDRVNYAYTLEDFKIIEGVPEAVKLLKAAGFLLVVITNQSGIAKGIYTREQMHTCHQYLQNACENRIDYIYYSPWHPTVSESLSRKPGSLMFERGIARFKVSPENSWMVGDKDRDLIPAKQVGLRTIQVDGHSGPVADYVCANLLEAAKLIINTAS